MEEPVLENSLSEADNPSPKERVEEMARAIERHPMEFVAVASLVGPVFALALGGDQAKHQPR